ncbi:unnamed protein product [Timema podura]|uniref:Uncharacterized protein n=1 Tax=Timema podura TaxID=61482 RepID=A0ABN7NUI7_TIMPD|nr:unnamed protein product [Timema podura]
MQAGNDQDVLQLFVGDDSFGTPLELCLFLRSNTKLRKFLNMITGLSSQLRESRFIPFVDDKQCIHQTSSTCRNGDDPSSCYHQNSRKPFTTNRIIEETVPGTVRMPCQCHFHDVSLYERQNVVWKM